MRITIGQIIDSLNDSRFSEDIFWNVKEHGTFESAKPFRADDDLCPQYAYICKPTDLPTLEERADSLGEHFFIFGQAEQLSAEEISKTPLSAAFVSGAEPIDLLDEIQSAQLVLSKWDEELSREFIAGAGLQELLDVSQDVLVNPLIMLDPAMKVLAYSGNIAPDDTTFLRTVALGFTPPEIMGQLIEKDYGQYIRDYSDETSYRALDSISKYAGGFRYIKNGDLIAAGIIVHCSVRPFTQGLIDTLEHFAKRISVLFEDTCPARSFDPQAKNFPYEKYFRYLLEGRAVDEEIAKSISNAFSYPFEAGFNLFVLTNAKQVPPDYMLTQVLEAMPDAKCILFEGHIVGITAFKSKYRSEDEYNAALQQTMEMLTQHLGCYCGFSRKFSNHMWVHAAYIQARTSVELGIRFLEDKNIYNTFHMSVTPRKRVLFYEDLYLHHMAHCCSREMQIESLCAPELLRLLEYDKNNNTDNYKILYIYLESTRNATEAGKLLHMHRNNVNYRIRRIQELFDINLENSRMCLKIQTSFRVLDLLQ